MNQISPSIPIHASESASGLPGWCESTGGRDGGRKWEVARNQQCGWQAYVLRLRFIGVYLPTSYLRQRPRDLGLIVSTEHFDKTAMARLVDKDDGKTELINDLFDARVLKRKHDGSMLIVGTEWDEGGLRRWPQTWLCSPQEIGIQVALDGMYRWLQQQYDEGRKRFWRR